MNRAVKRYLRQTREHLFCPRPMRKAFLLQLEDDLDRFCENREKTSYEDLKQAFGDPKDVAADFWECLDPKAVSRYSYTRLKGAYGILALVLAVSLCCVSVKLYEYIQTRIFLAHAQSGEECGIWHPCYKAHAHEPYVCMPEGAENCTVLFLRTRRLGYDYYWEYHSCINRFYRIPKPKDWDDTQPSAEDFYVTIDGVTSHWRFDVMHTGWYKIYDEE